MDTWVKRKKMDHARFTKTQAKVFLILSIKWIDKTFYDFLLLTVYISGFNRHPRRFMYIRSFYFLISSNLLSLNISSPKLRFNILHIIFRPFYCSGLEFPNYKFTNDL